MFQKYPIGLKILIVGSSTTASILLSIWLNGLFKSTDLLFKDTIIPFLLTWCHIFAAFMFFQTFKYFRLNQRLYDQKSFESPVFFKYLGVPIFRKILINSFFRHLNPRVYVRKKSRDEFFRLIEETKQAETSHLLSGFVTFIFQMLCLLNDHFFSFCVLSFFNLVFNFYPLLLQRANRFQFLVKLDKFS